MVPTDDTQHPEPAARPLATRLAILLVAFGLVLVVGFITWQGMARQRPTTQAASSESGVITIAVDGMSCVGCAGAVAATIEEIPGVAEVTVDYESRLARIRLADEHVAPATLVAAIEQAGYKAQVRAAPR